MSESLKILRIGTRGSPLALKQVEMVQGALGEHFPDLKTEVVVIQTSGDWKPEDGEVRLSEEAGGKGQFAKEIEAALLAGEIDCAVHSMKDMDSFLPDGLVIDHMLPREDVRDVLLFSNELADNVQINSGGFDMLPQGAVVGTASVQRAAFLLAERPDLKIEPFRGNVQTRIGKVRVGNVDVSLLALAGLNRLGISHEADVILDVETMLPSAGQGAVGIEIRDGDDAVLSLISRISHLKTVLCVKAERAALRVLDGACHTPIGAYATLDDGSMTLRVRVCSLDGRQSFYDDVTGEVSSIKEAEDLGREIGEKMKAVIPHDIFE